MAIGTDRGRVTGVDRRAPAASAPTIAADVVVNAGGMFAPEIGRMVGVTVPIIPMAHQYLFTEPIEGVHPGLPQLRDPDNLVYFREEVGGLCMGGYERDPAPWSLDGIPPDFNGKLLRARTWPRFESIMEGAIRRVPAIADAGVNRIINGPEGFTPDNEFILGEIGGPRLLRRRRVLARTGSPARAGSGGRWRRGSSTASPSSTSGRWTSGGSGRPYRQPGATRSRGRSRTTRPTTTSTTRTRSARPGDRCGPRRPTRSSRDLGAAFGEKSGWERPNWFESERARRRRRGASDRAAGRASTGRRRSAPRRSRRGGRPALFDETRFAKLEVVGPGATAFLGRMCANDVDRPVGSIVYTQLLNRRGGIEADLTVTRTGRSAYLIVTGTAFGNHDAGVAAEAPPGRRLGGVARRDLGARLLRAVGPAGARHPGRH